MDNIKQTRIHIIGIQKGEEREKGVENLLDNESESHLVVSDFVTSWTIQSMEFSRPEYWSG